MQSNLNSIKYLVINISLNLNAQIGKLWSLSKQHYFCLFNPTKTRRLWPLLVSNSLVAEKYSSPLWCLPSYKWWKIKEQILAYKRVCKIWHISEFKDLTAKFTSKCSVCD